MAIRYPVHHRSLRLILHALRLYYEHDLKGPGQRIGWDSSRPKVAKLISEGRAREMLEDRIRGAELN